MNRSMISLAALAVILVTVVWWLTIINPRNEAIGDAEDELAFEQAQEQTLRTRIAQLRDIREEEFTYLRAIEDIEESIPRDAELDEVIEAIHAIADETGVEIVALAATPPTFDAQQPEQSLFEIDLTLSLEGQYFEVLGFVIGLEDLPRLVRIDSVTMAPAQADQPAPTTTTSTTLAGTTSSTTSTTTTTTTLPPSFEPGVLTVSMRATLFTQAPLTPAETDPEGEAP